ncbi:MAG TPA: hypothetical protein VGS20_15730 [Candidatus Acidoferrales bacterium]|nr:hypothetical protein [Candidatus Acidoferrales bacterium]
MRGVFNPWFRVGETAAALGGVAWLTLWVYRQGQSDPTASWGRMDVRLTPILFLLGLGIGHLLGRRRLGLLRRVWPELEGRFFATEGGALKTYGEASSFVQHQNAAYAAAIVGAFFLGAYSRGEVLLFSSACAFAAGCLLMGKTVPLVRLWAERRQGPLGLAAAEEEIEEPSDEVASRRLAADVLVRLALGALMGRLAFATAVHAHRMAGANPAARVLGIDLRLAAIGLLVGALVGYPIGARRLRVLRLCWPRIPRFMFFADRRMLSRWPEGKSVVRLEKAAFVGGVTGWMALAFLARRTLAFSVIGAWYFLALYLVDLTLPSVRLWVEGKFRRSRSAPSA